MIVRRYGAAWRELKNHAMPLRQRWRCSARCRRAPAPAPAGAGGRDPAWLAVLAGGLTAGVVGALSEDSGPVLLVVAVFTAGCVAGYLWGRRRAQRRGEIDPPPPAPTIAVDGGSEGIA